MTSTARRSGRPAVAGALGHRAHVDLKGAAPRLPRPLLVMAAATALTAAALTVLALVDQQQISGADRWLKPWKFSVSITVYVLTLAWMTRLVRRHRRTALAMAGVATVAMSVELAIIIVQAGRARMSHFNTQTPLDATLWSIMGQLILLVWVATVVLALVLLRERAAVGAGLAVGVHWGLAVTVVGMLSAAFMVDPLNRWAEARAGGPPSAADGSHTIGALDGGPGLPLLGWSTVAGDLRVGHFVGLHALQLLPLLGWLLDRSLRWTDRQRRQLVRTAGVAHLGLVVLLVWQALRGESLVHPGLLTISATAGLATAVGIGFAVVLWAGASPSARGPTTDAVRRPEAPARTSDASLAPRP